jgi:hypothetical protein
MARVTSRLSAEDRRLIKREVAVLRFAAYRLAEIQALGRQPTRRDGPLVRGAQRVERFLGISR